MINYHFGAQEIEYNNKRILYLNYSNEAVKTVEENNLVEKIVFEIDKINHMAFIEENGEALLIYNFSDSKIPKEALDDFSKSGKIIGKKIKKFAGIGMDTDVDDAFTQFSTNAIAKYPEIKGRFNKFDSLQEAMDWIIL